MATLTEAEGGRAKTPLRPSLPNVNLPLSLSSFVGRDEQLAEVAQCMKTSRLVTLTGPPGIGKTRLAIEVASSIGERHPEGTWLVELAAITQSELVPRAVASALSVHEERGRPLSETLVSRLRSRELLMVLDNCEHLLGACAETAEALLRACAGVTILATSQEPLGIRGETICRVPPLSVPANPATAAAEAGSTEAGMESEGVRLFCDRARATNPTFSLGPDTGGAVGDICRRLDGIPLAIELAAARVDVLSPSEIAERLGDRFSFLTNGSRTARPRQQTLKAALDWSHDLLSVPERVLLRRLAVFTGGFTVVAAEAVCPMEEDEREAVFDQLARLVAKSLVVSEPTGSQMRYRLLETIRDYAWRRMVEAGEAAALRSRHAEWSIRLAEEAEAALTGRNQQEWLAKLEAEHDNLRAALDWVTAEGKSEDALRLAGALTVFWRVRGHFAEGRDRLARALTGSEEGPAGVKAKALWGMAFLASMLGDYDAAFPALEQSLALSQSVGDTQGCARSLLLLGNLSLITKGRQAGLGFLEQCVPLAREAGDAWCLAHALALCGSAHNLQGDATAARPPLEECIAVARRVGDKQSLAFGLRGLGYVALCQGDYELAETSLAEALEVARQLGETYEAAAALTDLGEVSRGRGDHHRARRLLQEALALARDTASPDAIVYPLDVLGCVAQAEDDPDAARRFFKEALAVARQAGGTVAPSLQGLGEVALGAGEKAGARAMFDQALTLARQSGHQARIARALSGLGALARTEDDHIQAVSLHQEALRLRTRIGEGPGIVESLEALAGLAAVAGRFEQATRLFAAAESHRRANGWSPHPARSRELDRDLALVREALPAQQFGPAWEEGTALSLRQATSYASKGRGARANRPATGWGSLTPAERDVAALAAEGLTNGEIAERLFISRDTVKGHVGHVLAKLGISSRRELRQAPGVKSS